MFVVFKNYELKNFNYNICLREKFDDAGQKFKI